MAAGDYLFWLGADAQPAQLKPAQHRDPGRWCRNCQKPVCLTARRMFCGCQSAPWELNEEEGE